ncbi:hypothetical protein P153DRAFT_397531 [Dothidotthia symphoricarpi CBS 119687]|uniref:BTB domain-containing protein n=1 Tax=Dothidotthia symphoricarpi CBS 119687 TaxID=1392245 RepID=A0A6A6AC32_9PLEO|nr:uncharacterized protein P153DRAFT_397531 [Dothidotthia symphoricarpi CBS 119687]KAF2128458.1 hypothetical protein P153DRAFT_397531 [Dothidotthia symphoricarpi CBS 119687]
MQSDTIPAKSRFVVGQKRKRPTFQSMDQTLVNILVGEGEKCFMVHKDLLCYHSKYFRGAFEGSFREKEDKTIRLRDINEGVFRLFQFWLYAQATRDEEDSTTKMSRDDHSKRGRHSETRHPCSCGGNYEQCEESVIDCLTLEIRARYAKVLEQETPKWLQSGEFLFDSDHEYFSCFIALSVFADQYDTPQLRRDVLTLLVELDNYNWDRKGKLCYNRYYRRSAQKAYTSLPPNAPIRQYLIKRFAYSMACKKVNVTSLMRVPQEFVVDVLLLITAQPKKNLLRENLVNNLKDCCDFHEHVAEVEREVCRDGQSRDVQFYTSFMRAIVDQVHSAGSLNEDL